MWSLTRRPKGQAFEVTIDKSAGGKLGVNVEHVEGCLVLRRVDEGGLVYQHNLAGEHMLLPGDQVVGADLKFGCLAASPARSERGSGQRSSVE